MAARQSASVDLPVPVEQVWRLLSDIPSMVAIDPAVEAYEPDGGTLAEGTLNRVTGRMGPLRTRMTTLTEVLDPPRRAVFTSVVPSRPVTARTEDMLESTTAGCRYTVTVTVTPTLPVVGHLAAVFLARYMVRSRRVFMDRLRVLVEDG